MEKGHTGSPRVFEIILLNIIKDPNVQLDLNAIGERRRSSFYVQDTHKCIQERTRVELLDYIQGNVTFCCCQEVVFGNCLTNQNTFYLDLEICGVL